MDKSREHDFPR